MKHLRVFCSYAYWPTWLRSETEEISHNIDPAELPLSVQTLERLLEWDRAFQATYNDGYPAEALPLVGMTPAQFELEGRELAGLIKDELGPTYVVSD
ncbi:MAG: hypothetical protein SFU83_23830 [Meiothermus sp.]|nr:hypothetical protein [Meiothermus sp.]